MTRFLRFFFQSDESVIVLFGGQDVTKQVTDSLYILQFSLEEDRPILTSTEITRRSRIWPPPRTYHVGCPGNELVQTLKFQTICLHWTFYSKFTIYHSTWWAG